MKLLIRKVNIVDSASPHNGKVKDVLIEDGIIKRIDDSIDVKADKTFEGKGKYLSIGWFDLRVNFREPGFEYKEDLLSGCKAAAAGGFTGVLCMPSTLPPVQSKSEIDLIISKTKNQLVDVFPSGTISINRDGKELSEMYDMFCSGAVAFTDDKNAVQNSGFMLLAMMYAKNFNGLIMSHADDTTLSLHGQMNESPSSTQLGLKGIPSLSEEMMINRDLFLAEYADCRIHVSTVSSAKSVDIIRKAKAKGIKVSCDVAAHQLMLDDSLLEGFDTNYKVTPPLRSKEDIEALKKGVADGTIDVICSDHSPEDIENKKKEFDHAAFGMIGLETAFAIATTSTKGSLSLEKLVEKFTMNPRRILSLPVPEIKEGAKANLTLFDSEIEWTFAEKDIVSKSKNTPFVGTTFKGKPIAVFNKGQYLEC